ncbi:MAG: helix-turn-helix transcriptional regulator [Corynebacteriales bacterium]|nr:helix-turn-helix transcriptional regulator [Mycobacteriales bacterium]
MEVNELARRYGLVVRTARTLAGLTLAQAGELCGYSASTLSRLERGKHRITDVATLRRLAAALNIPLARFGLPSAKVGNARDIQEPLVSWVENGGEDRVHRRHMLTGLAGLTGVAIAAQSGLLDEISSLLVEQPVSSTQRTFAQLTTDLATAQNDLMSCEYVSLTRRLPGLIRSATITRDEAAGAERHRVEGILASSYNLTVGLLLKVHENGMAHVMADRAQQSARAADDPIVTAETRRRTAMVLRRSPNNRDAGHLVTSAAHTLEADTGLNDVKAVRTFQSLLSTAAYTAALADNRAEAWHLIAEAEKAARRHGPEATHPDIASYKISIARALGDYGLAVEYAKRLQPAQIRDLDQRAQYYKNVAVSLTARGKPVQGFRMLLAAERDMPQEVRYRPWAQSLTLELLGTSNQNTLPGIREFADRIGIPA